MTKGTLSRDQAIAAVGHKTVDLVDGLNCDFTNRVQTDGDTRVEFSASTPCVDAEGYNGILVVYYYQEQADLDEAEELDHLNWTITGYEIY